MHRLLPLCALVLAACGWQGKRDPKDGEEDAPMDDCLFLLCDEVDGDDTGDDGEYAPLLGKWKGTCTLDRDIATVRIELLLTEVVEGGVDESDRYVGASRIAWEYGGGTTFVSTGAGHLTFTDEGGVEVNLTSSESGPPFQVTGAGVLERNRSITGRCQLSGNLGDLVFDKVSSE